MHFHHIIGSILVDNPFMPRELFYHNSLHRSISNRRGILVVLSKSFFMEIAVFNANSVDPDQTPLSVTSDFGLNCFPISFLWNTRHKWVKVHAV